MNPNPKKNLRDDFRSKVFERDGYACAICGYKPYDPKFLDAHHITDRSFMPFGGYVAANGITLCSDRVDFHTHDNPGAGNDCHRKAESLHETGVAIPGYAPTDLYDKIKSSYRSAYRHSLLLSAFTSNPLSEFQINVIDGNIKKVEAEELEVCLLLTQLPDNDTWDLACSQLGIDDLFIREYGKGRYYAPDE